MVKGRFDKQGQPFLPVELTGLHRTVTLQALVDTGFDIGFLNHLWRTPFMLRLHPTGYAQHERALKPLVLSVAQRSRRADRDSYGTSHLGSL